MAGPKRRSTDMTRFVTHNEFSEFREELRSDFRQMEQRFASSIASIADKIEKQRQPVTSYVAAGAFILSLTAAALAPLYAQDSTHSADIKVLEQAALDDARTRGQFEERFTTLQESVHAALVNRKDLAERQGDNLKGLEAKVDSVDDALRRRIDEVSHQLDNGLGRRIDEKLGPVKADIEWIVRRLESLP